MFAETVTNRLNFAAFPSSRQVRTTYVRRVGESVTMHSGVSEGALGGHYNARFYKICEDRFRAYANLSRGEDFSLTLPSVQLSDSGTYTAEIIIMFSALNSEITQKYPVPTEEISLTVYSKFDTL